MLGPLVPSVLVTIKGTRLGVKELREKIKE